MMSYRESTKMEDREQAAKRALNRTLAQLAGGVMDSEAQDKPGAPLVGSMTGNIIFMGEASQDALAMIFDRKANKRRQNG